MSLHELINHKMKTAIGEDEFNKLLARKFIRESASDCIDELKAVKESVLDNK